MKSLLIKKLIKSYQSCSHCQSEAISRKEQHIMNRLQLNYIKQKRLENKYIIPMVKMRKEINNSIIEELDTIYNPNIGGMDTEFKQSLNDVSLEHDFLEQSDMVQIIREFGGSAVFVYMYLHTKMCAEGYKIEWNDMAIDISCAMITSVYRITDTDIKAIINRFIEMKMLYIIKDGEKTYLTSLYQIYMYERISAKRLRDRINKRNKTVKKNEKYVIEQVVPAFEEADTQPVTEEADMQQVTEETTENYTDGFKNLQAEMLSLSDDIPFR